jgi:hypothetical protein
MKKMWRSIAFLAMLLGVLATAAWGEQVTTEWAVSAGYPGTPSKVVTDAQGNVYVTGSTYSADTNTATSTADMLTAKYDSNGVKQWEVTYNSPYNTGFDSGNSLVVDQSGNVYVVGSSYFASNFWWYGAQCATVVKYSPAGEQLWAARYNDTDFSSWGGAIDIDAAGNVYITVTTIYDHAWNSTAIDGVVVKYDTNGNRVWKYLMAIGHYGDDWATKIMVKNGNVYAAGTFNGGDHGYGDNMRNSMVWKFTLDGQLVWTAIHDGGGADYASDFTVDGQDNVYITSMSDRLLTGSTEWDVYAFDFATAKFDANGQLLWNSRYNNTGAGNHRPTSVAVDAVGDVYVTGESDGDGTTGKDLATVKYRGTDGTQLWADRYNGTANGNETGGTVLVNNKGDVYVSGTSLNVGTGLDFTTIKYTPDGTRKWVELYNGTASGNDILSSLAIDANNNIYVTGASNDAGGIPQFLTLKYKQNSADYVFSGFLAPVSLGKPFKLGSTVPVKFQLQDSTGAAVTSAVATLRLQKFSNNEPVGDPIEATSTSGADVGDQFRFSDGAYIFNLNSSTLGVGTYQIQVLLDDGTTKVTNLSFK